METTNVTLRMEKGLKESADLLFNSLGLSFNSAVNLFVRKSLRTQSIPFDVSTSSSCTRMEDMVLLLDSLLSSPEARERLANVGEGIRPTYHATTSVDEATALVESLGRQE